MSGVRFQVLQKHCYKKRILHRIKTDKRVYTHNFDLIKYRKEYYTKNKDALDLLSKTYARKSQGKKCLKIIMNWKEKLLPFSSLNKPNVANWKEYEIYRKRSKQFDILHNYYLRVTNGK